jgi:hypothetical protein
MSNDPRILTDIILSGAKTMQIKAEANNYLNLIFNSKLVIKFESNTKPILSLITDFLKPFLIETQDKKIEVFVR